MKPRRVWAASMGGENKRRVANQKGPKNTGLSGEARVLVSHVGIVTGRQRH